MFTYLPEHGNVLKGYYNDFYNHWRYSVKNLKKKIFFFSFINLRCQQDVKSYIYRKKYIGITHKGEG